MKPASPSSISHLMFQSERKKIPDLFLLISETKLTLSQKLILSNEYLRVIYEYFVFWNYFSSFHQSN